MAFEDDFVNSHQVCITENCKNYSLKSKETCKPCTEVKTLRSEIKKLHDHVYELEEHIVNLETNQVDEGVRRKAIKDNEEKVYGNNENVTKKTKLTEPRAGNNNKTEANLPSNIEKRLNEIENLLKINIDEKIERAIHRNLYKEKQTYASAVTLNKENEIMSTEQEYRPCNTSKEEVSRRNKNVIVYGLEECEDMVEDQENIQNFLHQLNINSTPTKTYRLGRKTEITKTRPVKIVYDNADDADETLQRSRLNRRLIERKNVHVRRDYSSEDRDQIRAIVQEAKMKNSHEATKGVTWKVRGCPRSKLYIEAIKIRTDDHAQNQTTRP